MKKQLFWGLAVCVLIVIGLASQSGAPVKGAGIVPVPLGQGAQPSPRPLGETLRPPVAAAGPQVKAGRSDSDVEWNVMGCASGMRDFRRSSGLDPEDYRLGPLLRRCQVPEGFTRQGRGSELSVPEKFCEQNPRDGCSHGEDG